MKNRKGLACLIVSAFLTAGSALATTWTVNDAGDGPCGGSTLTLTCAVKGASAGDQIQFAPGLSTIVTGGGIRPQGAADHQWARRLETHHY